jgi:hypothetical protein
MDVKFTVVSRALLNSVEKSDGQIIVIYDEPGMYYDMNTKRHAVLGMQYQEVFQKPTLASIPDANDRTFYFYNSTSVDGGLYLFNSTDRVFVRVSHPTGLTVKVSSLGTSSKMYLTGATSYNPSNPVQEYGSSSVYVQNSSGVSTLVAPKFQGNLDGTATKAQKDSNGNDITSYVKEVRAVVGTDKIQFIDGNNNVLVTITTTDTKNTAGSTNTTDKLFLVGSKTQGNNPQTYSNASVYTQGGELYSGGMQVANTENTMTLENKTIKLSSATITKLEAFGYNSHTPY